MVAEDSVNKHLYVWKSLIQLYRAETLNQQCFPSVFAFGLCDCVHFALSNIKEEKKMKEAAQKKIEAREC